MTANQRRPGFRLPWSDGSGTEADEAAATTQSADAGSTATPTAPSRAVTSPAHAVMRGSAVTAPDATPDAAPAPSAVGDDGARSAAHDPAPRAPHEAEPPSEFLTELVAAMRRVADEARQTGLEALKSQAAEQMRSLEGESEKRAGELRSRADTDVAGIGEWLATETERIRADAERRVAARRAELEQQLAAESQRAEQEISALRSRVSDYERELAAYHAQLAEINDPAAFAAAAKRMPPAPELGGAATSESPLEGGPAPAAAVEAVAEATAPETLAEPQAADDAEPVAVAEPAEAPVETAPVEAAPVEPVVAESAAERTTAESAQPAPAPAEAPAPEPAEPAEPAPAVGSNGGVDTSTAIVVKGLGSFGAITGFRQSLAALSGIESVSLSLGPTGEFVYRATHPAGMDVAAAIAAAEGEGVVVEADPDGTLRVTLGRPR